MVKAKTAVKPKTATSKRTVKKPLEKAQKKAVSKPEKVTFSPDLNCSFCGKPSKKARRLIALTAPSKICICDECIEVCIRILLEENTMEWVSRITRIFALHTEKLQILSEQKKSKAKTGAKKPNA